MNLKKCPDEYDSIPRVIDSLEAYVTEGTPPGDFLQAVLSNDLREAFGRADEWNTRNMHIIVRFCWNHIPSVCWGSTERVQAWLDFKMQQKRMADLAEKGEPDSDMGRMEHDDKGDN